MKCKECFYRELCKMTRCGFYLSSCDFFTSAADVENGKISISEVIPF
jgi:hypothetical protein